jgi:hypothetical protein
MLIRADNSAVDHHVFVIMVSGHMLENLLNHTASTDHRSDHTVVFTLSPKDREKTSQIRQGHKLNQTQHHNGRYALGQHVPCLMV